ncbi:MAG: MATE family efflux transporter [Firmicutes bacterium]|nr:MATE family efflux transporter [Bacillota bacterium]
MIDMIMVGGLGPAAIASVGLTRQPFMLLMAVFAAVNIGTTTLVAWNVGGKNLNEARSVTRQIIVVNFFLGLFMSAIGVCSARPVARFMGAGPDTMEMAVDYFQIVAAGLLFQAMTMGITASLRGAGETRIPMVYNVGSNLLNVFGNYVLIYGKWGFPQLGVAGAALSTTIARLLACLAGLYVLYFSRHTKISLRLKDDYRLYPQTIKKVFSIGMPAALEQFVLQSGIMMFARTVSALGTLHFAAHQIGININGLSFAPSMAFSIASTALVGQSLGAGDVPKAEKYAHTVHKMAVAVASFVGLMYILFSHAFARLYTTDLAVAAMAGTILKIFALSLPGQSTQLSLAGALRGAGDTVYPLIASALGIWIFRVFVARIFVQVFQWGLIGAWAAFVLDQYTRSIIIFLRFRSGEWKYARARVGKVNPA